MLMVTMEHIRHLSMNSTIRITQMEIIIMITTTTITIISTISTIIMAQTTIIIIQVKMKLKRLSSIWTIETKK